ncbi:hypothetical protein K2Q08_00315 [Patescibacteria group bacterium]|nr:hypothetical protein [Patescibacteria group bacterium]
MKDKLEDLPFVGTVTISHGISAEDAVLPPRDMFPEGPEGDEMWLNFDEGEFDGRYEDEN